MELKKRTERMWLGEGERERERDLYLE
jgi:hypothetical protein